ncbi:Hypothetical_protein [Hexamita inflata]|uniref:Hypothetical_protein n=1 Tax=Hexamita inflata TaxID=28002 RepID=A0AA86PK95_9EUKA|nr:Hypothetical protein HINF_LOCUS24444 [Hexamita inflata]
MKQNTIKTIFTDVLKLTLTIIQEENIVNKTNKELCYIIDNIQNQRDFWCEGTDKLVFRCQYLNNGLFTYDALQNILQISFVYQQVELGSVFRTIYCQEFGICRFQNIKYGKRTHGNLLQQARHIYLRSKSKTIPIKRKIVEILRYRIVGSSYK